MNVQTQQPAQINGIDVDALKETMAAIEAEPARGQTRWTVRSRWQGGTRSDHFVDGVTIGGQTIDRQFQIQIDEPHELCGSDQFANPQEYLLAATNACMMVGYTAVAALLGVTLTKLEVEIAGDIDLRGFLDIDPSVPPGYRQLHYKVQIAGDGSHEQFRQIHDMVQRTSPNFYNMSQPIQLTSELIVD